VLGAVTIMIEIWIEQSGRELLRQILADGQYVLGRDRDNEITVKNPNISRRHLGLDITGDKVTVRDLGSTNGTRLDGRMLSPNRAESWSLHRQIEIGDLILSYRPAAPYDRSDGEIDLAPERETAASSLGRSDNLDFAVVGAAAQPPLVVLGRQPIFVGSAPGCAMRLTAMNVAPHHCTIVVSDDVVEVTNLSQSHPVQLAGQALALGQPAQWPVNTPLTVGDATVNLTQQAADSQTLEYASPTRGLRENRLAWRKPLWLVPVAGILLLCLALTALFVIRGVRCETLSARCIFSFSGSGADGGPLPLTEGRATPTLAPFSTRQATPTAVATVELNLTDSPPSSAPVDCVSESQRNSGWLELPFPYQGTAPDFGGSAETFRRISQRSRFGGRINSFFDHEFPVYPPAFGGREPDDLDETLVIFNGVRSDDAYAQDTDTADWYSGHSGIDFAPADPRQPTTPILAPAAGRLLLARVDKDDNHMVWLEHDPDGDGRYQYATLYFHLHPDEHFSAMQAMEESTPIAAGQRIGTMGTTGRSSGVHLHFEVRKDVNRDGRFSIFERVDPYGWFPGQELVEDPWSALVSWIDSKGDEYEHQGIESEYLWVHPLVEVVDVTGGCQQVSNVKVDLYNVLGWAVVDPGFTYIARNDAGEILESGEPHRRTITMLPEDLDGVDPATTSLEWLDPNLDTWFTHAKGEPTPNTTGGYNFSAIVEKTGRYVLVAKEVVDRVPPTTAISLDGDQIDDSNTYDKSVLITLKPIDRGLIQSPIKETLYSLDCGQTWNVYDEPFQVTLNTPHMCGETAADSQTIELDEHDFLLLAMSEDSENNIEQPPAQIRFRIE
jgi:murein DD-endopeptidase MepM/ murein hydrolase activator NlpD